MAPPSGRNPEDVLQKYNVQSQSTHNDGAIAAAPTSRSLEPPINPHAVPPRTSRSSGAGGVGPRGLRSSIGTIQQEMGHFLKSTIHHVPLKAVIIISLCFFTVAPAIVLWFLSWDAGKTGLDSMDNYAHDSVEDVVQQLRSTMMGSANTSLLQLVLPAEQVLDMTLLFLKGTKVLEQNGETIGRNFTQIWESVAPIIYFAVKANPTISMISVSMLSDVAKRYSDGILTSYSQWVSTLRMNIDLVRGTQDDTVYEAKQILTPDYNGTTLTYNYLFQDTGKKMFTFYERQFEMPLLSNDGDTSRNYVHYQGHLLFSQGSGVPSFVLDSQMPFSDNKAALEVGIYINCYTVSAYLRSLLHGPKERLFANFRNAKGELIGASHGKFFSHSDLDLTTMNAVTNPPPLADFRTFTPLNSTDAVIAAAAAHVVSLHGDWDAIPELTEMEPVNGEIYWISTAILTSRLGLRLNLFFLVDRASKLGQIEHNKQKTMDDISRTNTKLTIILCFVVVFAFIFALIVSLVLTRALGRLASGMNTLALLRFEDTLQSLLASESRFTEVSKCERSFMALERGLKAFVRYVPRDVVRLMLSGDMQLDNSMMRCTVTIMFMDIASFSSLCEKISSEQLVELTSSYLLQMCEIVVRSGGTLDKFIGDCIMAMWNAPRRLAKHETAAIGAALDMQRRLVKLWDVWDDAELPQIKFRIGINTASVLVGNFGCDYRINYTCLGDGVNLASRLEAANKPFGTVALVSESTRVNADDHFVFRKVGLITVPGKTEVLPIYEPLLRLNPVTMGATASGAEGEVGSPPLTAGTGFSGTDLSGSTVLVDPLLFPFSRAGQPQSPQSPTTEDSSILFHWKQTPAEIVLRMVGHYEKGLEAFIHGNLDEAEKLFGNAHAILSDDGPTNVLLSRSRTKRIPGAPWDGVIRFDHK